MLSKFLNIQTKLMAVLLIPLMSIIFIISGVFSSLNNLNTNFSLVNESRQRNKIVGDLLVSLQNASSSLGFSLGSDSHELATVRNYEAQFNNSATELETNIDVLLSHENSEESQNILLEAKQITQLFISQSQESFKVKKDLLSATVVDVASQEKLLNLNDQIQKNKESLSNKVNEIVIINNQVTSEAVSEYERTLSSLYSIILIESIFSVLVMIIVGYFASYFSVIKPVKSLTAVATDISRGKLDAKIDQKVLDSTDEIGDLAKAFDRTMVSLKLAMKSNQNS